MEEALSQDDNVGVVLEEILRKVDDREPSSEALSDQVTSEGRYKEAASWFIESPVFRKWSCHFYPFDNTDGTEFEDVPKRVLWVSGTYGTGKTTVMYVSLLESDILSDIIQPSVCLRIEKPGRGSSNKRGLEERKSEGQGIARHILFLPCFPG